VLPRVWPLGSDQLVLLQVTACAQAAASARGGGGARHWSCSIGTDLAGCWRRRELACALRQVAARVVCWAERFAYLGLQGAVEGALLALALAGTHAFNAFCQALFEARCPGRDCAASGGPPCPSMGAG